jgi:N-acetylglutamate synthase-like GNAT family acetyltransferase
MEFRMMKKTDFGEIVNLMEKAFFHSTLYTWAAPDEAERRKILSAMFRFRVSGWIERSLETELAVDTGVITGSATWIPPRYKDEPPGIPRSMDEVYAGIDPAVVERWLKFQPVIEAQEKIIALPAWELAPIAILPEKQGKKIGASLINRKLAVIDKAGLPCYIFTQDAINLAIYERFGFKTIEAIPVAEGGPLSYSMIREGRG